MGMSVTNVENRIRKGVPNLDKDRFRIYHSGIKTATVVVVIDNKIYTQTFEPSVANANLIVEKLNIVFDENRWDTTVYAVVYDFQQKMLGKAICRDTNEAQDFLEAFPPGTAYWQGNELAYLSREEFMKV